MTLQTITLVELSPGTQITEFDSSAQGKTYRVELLTGVHFQINEKLYQLLTCVQTAHSLAALATAFEQRTGESVALDQLLPLAERLITQGILTETLPNGQPVPVKPAQPAPQADALLGLQFRRDLFSAKTLAPLANALQLFFNWPLAVLTFSVVALAHLLAYRQMGFPPNVDMKLVNWPLFMVILLISIGIHELGHLAACRRWQCPHGPLGFGLYFFSPVFYVDVTAAWRLSRRQRMLVDIGGMYLQLMLVPLFWVGFLATHEPTFLFAIMATDLMIMLNFEPLMKLDGYWLLSDWAGVPNLHTRTGEVLQQALLWSLWRLRWRQTRPQTSSFSQWPTKVRLVMLVYMALTVLMWPLMLGGMFQMAGSAIVSYPTLWQAALVAASQAVRTHDFALLLTESKALFLPTLILFNLGFMVRMIWKRWRIARTAKTATLLNPKVQPI